MNERPSLPATAAMVMKLKLARFLLELARLANYEPKLMRIVDRLVKSAERTWREAPR